MASFDLNELPVDENGIISVNEESMDDHHQTELADSGNFEPFVGQTFRNEEEAFVMYQNYARFHGFSVRKDRSKKKRGETVRRDFFCHRGRTQPKKEINPEKEQRNRLSIKCDCNAHMRIKWRRANEIFPEQWHVTTFIANHNHDLLPLSGIRFLPVNRVICPEDENRILLLKDAGLTIRQIIRVLELEKNINHGELPFLERDIRNLFGRVRMSVTGNDVTNLLDYLKLCKEKNPKFQYVYTVDQERKFEHLFWCPAECFEWYQKFGDVVVFDTTYKVNIYNMPCGIFVDVNNHGKTVLFGFALLRNETVASFEWLMKTFVAVMKKSPKTIITDQDPWMKEAIAKELPNTKHSFCIWHITYKFSGWFAPILRNEYQDWCKDFYKLYRLDVIEDFEREWPLIIAKYNLVDNKHINGLYKLKQFWVPAYLRGYYFGGMTTTGRAEYINGFIKRFVSSNCTLTDLAKQVEIAVVEIKQKQSHDNMLVVSRMNVLKVSSPLERQISKIFTTFAFEKFKDQYQKASQYMIVDNNGHDFVVRYHEGDSSHNKRVFWDGNITMCSCKLFEFLGILCRHILRVFIQMDCYNIPSIYLPSRWQLHDDRRDIDDSLARRIIDNVEMYDQNVHLEESCTQEENFEDQENLIINGETISCPPKSVTKGRPRNKRIKGGKESAVKQKRRCSLCREHGHYVNNCPTNKKNGGVDNETQKKKAKASDDKDINPVFSVKC